MIKIKIGEIPTLEKPSDLRIIPDVRPPVPNRGKGSGSLTSFVTEICSGIAAGHCYGVESSDHKYLREMQKRVRVGARRWEWVSYSSKIVMIDEEKWCLFIERVE